MPAGSDHKGCFAVPLLAVVAGLFLTYWYAVRPMVETNQAEGWVAVEAEVVESRVEEAHSSRSYDYEPLVVYSYVYEGTPHESHQLAFSSMMKPERRGAMAVVKQYPVGSKITVYVNPQAPSEAVVLRDREQDLRLKLIGPMLILVAIVFFVMLARRRAQQEEPVR